MAKINFQGHSLDTYGELPSIGDMAPPFSLVRTDLSTLSLSDLKGKRLILNIFPSLDTDVCATTVRHFNQLAASMSNTIVLAISKDLPFAHARFCSTEGIERVIPLSAFRDASFGTNYGVELINGPLAGLFARAIVLINEQGKVTYTELVPEITEEPNYESILIQLKSS